MTTANTRNEPTLGNLVTGLFTKSKLSHESIVNDALDAFTKAEDKMNTAIELIDADIKLEEQAIKDAEQRITNAGKSKDRLTRVIDRVRAFTA